MPPFEETFIVRCITSNLHNRCLYQQKKIHELNLVVEAQKKEISTLQIVINNQAKAIDNLNLTIDKMAEMLGEPKQRILEYIERCERISKFLELLQLCKTK